MHEKKIGQLLSEFADDLRDGKRFDGDKLHRMLKQWSAILQADNEGEANVLLLPIRMDKQ